MDPKLLGQWRLARSENVDEFMKALNVNFMMRKLAQKHSYDMEFVNEADGNCKIIVKSTFKNTTIPFKIGEEFDEDDTLSGKKYRSVYFLEDGVLLTKRRNPVDKKDPTLENKFYINGDGELVNPNTIVSVEPNITSTRILKRL